MAYCAGFVCRGKTFPDAVPSTQNRKKTKAKTTHYINTYMYIIHGALV